MAGAQLLKKLRMLPEQRVLILNAPPGYLDELAPLPEGVELAQEPQGTFDFVQVFAKDLPELERLAPVAKTGLRPVTQVSVNDVWSALRFRRLEKVGK